MTHINAYHGDVEDKKQAVLAAQAELTAAEEALKAHPDYEQPEEEVKADEPTPKKVAKKK